ncbi:hypothetical protein [Collimonas arenae]|nr:hypothetical protein [Collimonas arenae]
MYASIAIRIDAELQRLLRTVELGGELAYDNLQANTFLVSKERYAPRNSEKKENAVESEQPKNSLLASHIGTVNFYTSNANDVAAVSGIEKMEKASAIGSNFSSIIGTLIKFFGA